MKKRVISLAVCVAFAVCMYTLARMAPKSNGIKGSMRAEGERYKEFLTVDVFDALANCQGIQSGWFGKVVKDKFNMELNIIAPNAAGGGDALFQTRSAAGNLGDLVISGTENGRFKNMVDTGLLCDMTELLKGKDILKNYHAAIEKVNANVGQAGIYGIPSEISSQPPTVSADGIEPLVAPYVRWDIYKAVGCPAMGTLDDFIPVMKQMQENTPVSDSGRPTYAISLFRDWDGNMMVGAKNYASLYGYNELGFVLAKADGSDLQDIISDDGQYVRALRFLFRANQEGLVDPESTIQNYDTLLGKYRDGQILTSLWSWQGASVYNTLERKRDGKGFMPAFIEDISAFSNGCYYGGNCKTIIAVGSSAQDPQRMADFIDWLYSPEGMEIAGQASGAAGPRGLTWDMENGKAVLTDFGKKALPNNAVEVPQEWGGGLWKDGASALNFKALSLVDTDPDSREPYMATMWDSVLAENTTQLDLDWQEYADGAKSTLEFLDNRGALSVAPGSSYIQPEESSDITILRNQCKAVIVDSSWHMIFAADEAEFDSILEHMQTTVRSLGYDEVLAVDMEHAQAEADSRRQAVADFNGCN